MERERFARLVELMAAMAGGRIEAAFALRDEFAGALRRAVRRALRARQVDLPKAEIDELVADAALVLFEHAGSWRPEGGALPVGLGPAPHRQRGRPPPRVLRRPPRRRPAERLGGQRGGPGGPARRRATSRTPFELLESMAGRDPRLRALADALNEVATPEGPGDVAGDAGPGGAWAIPRRRRRSAGATACRRRRPASSGTGWASGSATSPPRDERFAAIGSLPCVA